LCEEATREEGKEEGEERTDVNLVPSGSIILELVGRRILEVVGKGVWRSQTRGVGKSA